MFKKKKINIGGKNFFYWEKNQNQKRVIFFLHGFPGNHFGIMDVARNIDGYRVIVPDLPACGQSEPFEGSYRLESYAKWLNDFINSLSIKKTTLIGHSFGSRVSLVFNSLYPDKIERLVLITPVLKVEGLIARFVLIENKIAEVLPESLKRVWLSSILHREVASIILFKSASQKRREKLIARDKKELKRLYPQVNIELFLSEFYKDSLVPIGKKVKVKSLIIAGNQDQIAPIDLIKELSSQLATTKLVIIKDSGHALPMERPVTTANIIKEWMQQP